jgi:hypothetical protein
MNASPSAHFSAARSAVRFTWIGHTGRWIRGGDAMMSLAELGVGPRTSLLLRERDEMSVADIAVTLNATPQQVREWLFEARERLCAAEAGAARWHD